VDPTVINQLAAGSVQTRAAGPPVPDAPVVVGDIPALRPGFQPRPRLLARLNRTPHQPSAIVVLTGPEERARPSWPQLTRGPG
jgi:hypothetical protein